jgi:hypothetical protein
MVSNLLVVLCSEPGAADRQHWHSVSVTCLAERKSFLLRADPALLDAVSRWAADDLRSLNAQIEFLLRRALQAAGRLPKTEPERGATERKGSKDK